MATFDEAALDAALRRITASESASSLDAVLQRLVTDISTLFGGTGAGLMLLDEEGSLRYAAASNDDGRILEEEQTVTGEGPCVSALIDDHRVVTADVTVDPRWPVLGPRLAETKVRAVMGLPVHVAATPIGSLDIYYDTAHEWDDAEADALARFNEVVQNLIGSSLLAHRRDAVVRQLQLALDSRIVIERAIGLLMGRDGLSSVEAFNTLRRAARTERRRVHDVAKELVEQAG